MNFNEKLNELIFKYGVDKCCPNYRKYIEASALTKTLYSSFISQGERCLLLGIDETEIRAFQAAIGSEDDFRVKYYGEISDIEPGSNVLLVSYYQKDEIAVKMLERNVNLVSLYDFFEKKGLYFNHNFYDIYNEQYWDGSKKEWAYEYEKIDINRVYFHHRRRYELEPEGGRKKFYLEKMIFDCVYVKDFLTLRENIDKYSLAYGDQSDNYALFYQELEALLEELKTALATRQAEDIIVFWLDALEYDMDETMPFLKELDERALVFDKAFTVTPYTSPTFLTILTGKLQIEDETYSVTNIGEKDSILVRELQERGYRFKYYGNCLNHLAERRLLPTHFYRSNYYSFTQLYWDVLTDMIEVDRAHKNFCILHELYQTHAPFVSLGLKGTQYTTALKAYEKTMNDLLKKQKIESADYVDKQLKFWNEMLQDRMYKIYMSDHGNGISIEKTHVILKIQQKDICPYVCDLLFSYANFWRLVLQLIDDHSFDEQTICNNYSLVQEVAQYSKARINEIVSKKEFYSFHPEACFGFQGVVTGEDLFICYRTGFEYYQKHINDHKMVTDARLNYLRGLISKKTVDYFHEEKFRYTRILLTAEQRREERTKDIRLRKQKVIESIFDQIQDMEVLALRGGGCHTLNLIMPLKEQYRNKVKYIIDGNHRCVGGKMGIEVIALDEMLQKGVTTVLISSYQYLQEWEQELHSYDGIRIINMYRILEEHGLPCEMEACFEKFIDEDFDLSLADV